VACLAGLDPLTLVLADGVKGVFIWVSIFNVCRFLFAAVLHEGRSSFSHKTGNHQGATNGINPFSFALRGRCLCWDFRGMWVARPLRLMAGKFGFLALHFSRQFSLGGMVDDGGHSLLVGCSL